MKLFRSLFLRKYSFYIISFVALLAWIMFFDRSNLINQFRLELEYRSLKNQKEVFDKELKKVMSEEREVMGNEASIEKFAREKYYMKKEGETVFILVDKKDKPISDIDK